MRYNTIHADAAADPVRRGKTRRRNEHPRWPSSLKEKVKRIVLENRETDREGKEVRQ